MVPQLKSKVVIRPYLDIQEALLDRNFLDQLYPTNLGVLVFPRIPMEQNNFRNFDMNITHYELKNFFIKIKKVSRTLNLASQISIYIDLHRRNIIFWETVSCVRY